MHKVYKLLRNNRQTGPYTLEELAALGLKPFDLIWEEGKGGGWSYPSEIDSLKPYVADTSPASPQKETPLQREPIQERTPEPLGQPAAQTVKELRTGRHIFVRLPAGANMAVAGTNRSRVVPATEMPVPAVEEESAGHKLERKALELRQRVQALAEIKKEEEPTLDTKYARSLDEIKEEYTHWMRAQKRKGSGWRLHKKQLVVAAAVLLIGMGGVLGVQWVISNRSDTVTALTQPAERPAQPGRTPAAGYPVETVVQKELAWNTAQLNELENANELIAEDLKRLSGIKPKTVVQEKEDVAVEAEMSDYGEAGNETIEERIQAPVVEKSRSYPEPAVRSQRSEITAVPLDRQIEVQAKYKASGKQRGVPEMELTVRNNSEEVLKFVAVDVLYYREDQELVAKKTLYFNDLQPHEALTLPAPGNKRASTAGYQLGLISSDKGALWVVR